MVSLKEQISPAQVILVGFAGMILVGTALLMLPISVQGPGGASFMDALFTATSATCVTGLVLYDTATYWTCFGHGVILTLIQIGGLGVVTMGIAVTIFSGKRIGLKQRLVMQESISAPQMGGIVRITNFILRSVLLMEGVGALLLALRFCPEMGFWKGIWYGIFHSISAFCNAGFDLLGTPDAQFVSLTDYQTDPLVNGVIMLLIVLGGIGFLTWKDVADHRHHFHAYRLQSKLVLVVTLALLVLPALYFYFYEFSLTQWNGLGTQERVLGAAFQSVAPRTAGFNTIDLNELSMPSKMLTVILMLIGGSSGSTAGGFKTTTLAVFILAVGAAFHRRESLQCFGRRLNPESLRSAMTITFLYLVLTISSGMVIACVEGVALSAALFETASAIGTVGLSLGLTSNLSTLSQIILVFLMYFGRVGGLTLIYAVINTPPVPAQLPQERITVG